MKMLLLLMLPFLLTSLTNAANWCYPILIQQNVDGSYFFHRSWNEFKAGFHGSNGNYWLGNEVLHLLTKNGDYKLRFDLQSEKSNRWYYAEYSKFIVHNEATGYQLEVGGFSGNVSLDAVTEGVNINGAKFSTLDRDNDERPNGNIAADYINAGGFWYKTSSYCNVNAVRGKGYSFSWWCMVGWCENSLKTSRMWLTCR